MTISFPVDIITDFPGWSTSFEIDWQQQTSRTRGGKVIVKDIAPALWRATYRSRSLKPNELDQWRARLDVLENGMQTFRGFHKARCFPILDPNGTVIGASTPKISAINGDNKSVKIADLPANYVISVGDMVSYQTVFSGRFLHRVVAGASAPLGVSDWIELRPHLPPGIGVNNLVTLVKPWVPMGVVPGSISTDSEINGRGRISFNAIEDRT